MFGFLSFITGIISFGFGFSIYTEVVEEHKSPNYLVIFLFIIFLALAFIFDSLDDSPSYNHNIWLPA